MAITLQTFTPYNAILPATDRPYLAFRNGIPTLSYPDDGTDRAAYFLGKIPASSGAGPTGALSVKVVFLSPATSGNVVIDASFERHDSGTDLDSDSFDTAVESSATATAGTSGAPTTVTISFADNSEYDGLVAGEEFRLRLRAVTSDAGYTLGNILQVLTVEIQEPGTANGGGGGGTGSFSGIRTVTDVHSSTVGAPTTITTSMTAGVFYNRGGVAKNGLQMVGALPGHYYGITNVTSHGIRITAASTHVFWVSTAISTEGGYIETTELGAGITFTAIDSATWFAEAAVGLWEVV